MSETGEQHCHAVRVAVVDALLVAYRAARLNHGVDALLVGDFDAVAEREERIRRHHGPRQVEPETFGFRDGLFQRIHARGLADAAGDQHTGLGQYDRVAFRVLDDLVRENQVRRLLGRSVLLGRVVRLSVYAAYLRVAVLYGDAVQQRAEQLRGALRLLEAQDNAVFLAAESYRLERLAIWRDPEKYEKGFQTIQGLYAIGSGGIFGKGFGNSLQKLGFVPEAQNDMIFSIVCEETGILGAFLVLFLFGLLIWRLCMLALNCRDLKGTLLCAGIMAHMSIQVVLNVAVVTNTIPNTGITLPFVSYGGTSVVFLLGEMGLALSVSSHRHGRIT